MLNVFNSTLSDVTQTLAETTHTASKQLPSINDHPLDWGSFKPDYSQAVRQLRLLGIEDSEQVHLRALSPKGFKSVPAKNNSYTVQDIADGKYSQSDRLGRYFVVNSGGQSAKDITACRAIFFEHDDLPKDEQVKLWCKHGLPDPTFQVETRNSIHSYWVFDQPIEPKLWSPLIVDLINLVGSDKAVKDLPRVLRLAGYWDHSFDKEGNPKDSLQVKLINETAARYTYEELRDLIPMPQTTIKPPVALPYSQAQTSRIESIPLSRLISKKNQEIINCGVSEGSRNATLYELARDVIGAESHALSTGLQFAESARELFNTASANCSPQLEPKELESIWRSAEKGNPTPCLDSESWGNVLSAWNRKDQLYLYSESASSSNNTNQNTTEVKDQMRTLDLRYYELKQTREELERQKIALKPSIEIKPLYPTKQIQISKGVYKTTKDKDGQAVSVNQQLTYLITKHFDFKYNQRKLQLELNGQALELDCLSGIFDNDHGIIAKEEEWYKCLKTLAAKKEYQYDPCKDWVESFHKDQKNNKNFDFTGIAARLFGCDPNSEFSSLQDEYVRLFLLGLVARLYSPGISFDQMLVLYSPGQGKGKTEFFKALAGKGSRGTKDDIENQFYNVITDSELTSKDSILGQHQAFINIADELDRISRSTKSHQASILKMMLSQQVDKVRIPFAIAPKDYPRRYLYCGTTNKPDSLEDASGNRRFWVIELGQGYEIDIEDLKSILGDLYATSVESYLRGDKPKLDRSYWAKSADLVEQYCARDALYEPIADLLEGRLEITVNGVLKLFHDRYGVDSCYGRLDRDKAANHKIPEILKQLGFYNTGKRSDTANRGRSWLRVDRMQDIEKARNYKPPIQTPIEQQTEQRQSMPAIPQVEPQQRQSKPFEHQYPENIKPLPKDWIEPDPRETMVKTQSMPATEQQTEQRQSMPVIPQVEAQQQTIISTTDQKLIDKITTELKEGADPEILKEKYINVPLFYRKAFEQATSQASTLG